jgi:hypothetical protein
MKRKMTHKEKNKMIETNIKFLQKLTDMGELDGVEKEDIPRLCEDWYKDDDYVTIVTIDYFYDTLKDSFKPRNILSIWNNIREFEETTDKELFFVKEFVVAMWTETKNYLEANRHLSTLRKKPVKYDSFYDMYEVGDDILVHPKSIKDITGKYTLDSYQDYLECQLAKEFPILVKNTDINFEEINTGD